MLLECSDPDPLVDSHICIHKSSAPINYHATNTITLINSITITYIYNEAATPIVNQIAKHFPLTLY